MRRLTVIDLLVVTVVIRILAALVRLAILMASFGEDSDPRERPETPTEW